MQSGRSSSALFRDLHQRRSGVLHGADYRLTGESAFSGDAAPLFVTRRLTDPN